MHCKKITFLPLFFVLSLLFLNSNDGFSQNPGNKKNVSAHVDNETFENIYLHWFIAVDKARISAGISQEDFDVFTRFSQKRIDSVRGDFMQRIYNKTVTSVNVGKFELTIINSILSIYKKYETIKKAYPSSVEEFKTPKALPPLPCNPACNNIDFATGNLTGWNAFYGFNNSSGSFNITNIAGGPAGAVTHAANDVLTSTLPYYNAGSVGPNPSPDYQVNITSGIRGDAIVPSIPVVSPFGGLYSVMLGDSSQVNYGVAILSQTFLVTPSNENFTYQYAVFLANPIHNYYQQPFFSIVLLDQAGDTIPNCGKYNVVAGHGTDGFDSVFYRDTFPDGNLDSFFVFYKNWTIVDVPLKRYVGQCVTIIFESADCSLGGHFGYAYVDASCSPNFISASSPNLCGQDSISLTAPPGGANYIWSGPSHSILGNSHGQTVWVDSSGIYRVIVVPVTGFSCADTLYDTIGRVAGPPPRPDFHTIMACTGDIAHFINTSPDTANASFYWDFYNIGVYNDSNIVNPTWVYARPGVYTVKLDEVYKGCGADTTIRITVDNPAIANFTVSNACVGSTVSMTNTSTSSTKYLWNYGDPRSGPRDTSSVTNGSHLYSTPGIYFITLIANNSGLCPDTVTHAVKIFSTSNPVITGLDSICLNYKDTLKATGGLSYVWSTGATTSSIVVASATTQTVNVLADGGVCSSATTFTVHIVSPAAAIKASKDSVCKGEPTTLSARGGLHYRWSTGSTLSSISVSPLVATSYTLYATIGECTDSTTITVRVFQAISFTLNVSQDSICPGDTTLISVPASGGPNIFYRWSTGQTTSSIYQSPRSTKTYTVQVGNGVCAKDTTVTIFVKKVPALVASPLVDSLCIGGSVVLNASGADNYNWSPAAGLSCLGCPNPTATPSITTSYVVVGTDVDGCTATRSVYVIVETPPVLAPIPDQTTCAGGIVTLIGSEISGFYGNFKWEPGGSTNASITISPNATSTYTVQYTNLCGTASTSVTVFVKPEPIPFFSADITSGCAPLCVQFRDRSTSPDGNITMWSWAFGNGDTVNEENPIFCYPDTGSFTPSLTAISSNGCSATLKVINMITIFHKPLANFIYTPQPVGILVPTVQFTDESKDLYGIAYRWWTFGDGGTNNNNSLAPVHTYGDTGIYCPQLIVENDKGCLDTATNCLFVEPLFTLYIPSAFSPNADGTNDVFEAKGTYIKTFEMYIFDRWGMELFHSTDIHQGWNGTVNGGNVICQEDTYVYKITATDWSDTQHSYIGAVTLLK